MPISLTFHESQYPAQVAAQLQHGLQTRALPCKFLYESPAQAQRWLAYHQAYSPSRTDPALLTLYQCAFQVALQSLPAGALHYISLGCGGGTKDALFLQQAVAQRPRLLFTPMDTSAALALDTILRVHQVAPHVSRTPLIVDLGVEPDLAPWLAAQEAEPSWRLLACFGLLPNFDYHTFLPYLRRLMRPADMLLLSANLSPLPYPAGAESILPQYDNPFAHAWYRGLLESLGFTTAQSHLRVSAVPLHAQGQIWQVHVAAHLQHEVVLHLDGTTYSFAAGETLQLFFSHRFTPHIMPDVLTAAGLRVVDTWLFASQEEAIYLCTPT